MPVTPAEADFAYAALLAGQPELAARMEMLAAEPGAPVTSAPSSAAQTYQDFTMILDGAYNVNTPAQVLFSVPGNNDPLGLASVPQVPAADDTPPTYTLQGDYTYYDDNGYIFPDGTPQ